MLLAEPDALACPDTLLLLELSEPLRVLALLLDRERPVLELR